ncbi:MAG: hypothetical protein IPN17_27330 [Deltaproteobacteria bacterium]|nr:hypothetical protein [Deltaproteobacteria bacterium]
MIASGRYGPKRLARRWQGGNVGLVIYDECHHATAEDNRRCCGSLASSTRVAGALVGFTATTPRADGMGLE